MVEWKLFLLSQSINIVHPNKENMFVVPNLEKNTNYYENPSFSPLMVEIWFQRTLYKENLFSRKQSIKIMYPSGDIVFIVANHKKNVNYCTYPCFSYLRDEFWLEEKLWKKSFCWETKVSISCIIMRRPFLRQPITKKNVDLRLLRVSMFVPFHDEP